MASRRKGLRKDNIVRNNLDEVEIKQIEDERFEQLVDDRVSDLHPNYLESIKNTLTCIKEDLLENF